MTDTFRHIVWSKNVRSFTHEGPQLTIYMFRLSMSFGKMCLLIIRSIYFWYCLYLFAKCKWEVEQWFSCFEWFPFFFALFKKDAKFEAKTSNLCPGPIFERQPLYGGSRALPATWAWTHWAWTFPSLPGFTIYFAAGDNDWWWQLLTFQNFLSFLFS